MGIGTSDGKYYESSFDLEHAITFGDQESKEEPKNNLFLVRHGDTADNEEDLVHGWVNTPLNDKGIEQAHKAADSLKDKEVTRIVSSDLPRAKQTANIISQKLGVPVEFRPELRTWNTGDFDGTQEHDELKKYTKPGDAEWFNFSSWFGGPRTANATTGNTNIEADKSAPFPSVEDAKNAIKNEAFYASPFENFANNKNIRIWKYTSPESHVSYYSPNGLTTTQLEATVSRSGFDKFTKLLDTTTPEGKAIIDKLSYIHARAALATNRSAIASLGFNPNLVAMDSSGDQLGVAGLTSLDHEGMWVSSGYHPHSTTVHEALHRGFDKLQLNYPTEYTNIVKDLPHEVKAGGNELMVRYIMNKIMNVDEGNNDDGTRGPAADQQIKQALKMFNDNPKILEALNKLEDLAATHIAKKRPGGPR